jgi:hypothetical protein
VQVDGWSTDFRKESDRKNPRKPSQPCLGVVCSIAAGGLNGSIGKNEMVQELV